MIDEGYKVLIVGDYPPPYGGLSVQIAKLQQLICSLSGASAAVLDIGASRRQDRQGCIPVKNSLDFLKKVGTHARRRYIIHLHTNGHNTKSWLVSLVCAIVGMANNRNTVLTIGSGLAPDFIERAGPLTRRIIRSALNMFGAVICRNDRMRVAILRVGLSEERLEILEGFYGITPEGLGPLPPQIESFLGEHSPVVGAMGSIGPEYGIPLLLEAAHNLRARYPRLGVILIGPSQHPDAGLEGDLMVTGSLPNDIALAVMEKLTLFVRPTYFDGDASSVREALTLGMPVIASDTDFRPPGVTLFRCGDSNDLTVKISQALDGPQELEQRAQVNASDSLGRLLAVYRRLGNPARLQRTVERP